MNPSRTLLPSVSGAFLLLCSLSACDQPAGRQSNAPPVLEREPSRSPSTAAQPRQLRERQAAFLNRIRSSDPQNQTIDKAVLNENNELGLILDRRVEMDKIPDLMRAMLTQMAHDFPNEDLTVVVYAPSTPPRKMGTAHLDSRTREMTYTKES